MKIICFIILILYFQLINAQTWSDHVASIMYAKCSTCHHEGGIAPFSLMSYSDASSMSNAIHEAVLSDKMPPFPPDRNYQQYAHSRALSELEKSTILQWIENGFPEGNPVNTPPPPIFNIGSILGEGDLELQMPHYMSKANAIHDDYVCISIPTNLLQDRKIKALEIIPGNRQIVHHCLVYLDESGTYTTDTIGGDCTGPTNAKLLMGYTPGSSPLILPSGSDFKLGMSITAGSNIVFAMHYPNGSFGMVDSTKIIFHFYPINETGIREVSTNPVLQNWNIFLPANQIKTLEAQFSYLGYNTLPANFSILSVFPHMHLLGKEIKVYGLDPQGDTLKFIHIPNWDFHWQDFYFFKHIQKAPAGSSIKAYAVYDNTENNPHNPHSPPQTVFAGESTSDEMFLVYFQYLLYQPGDENYDIESLMSLGLQEYFNDASKEFIVFPNPFDHSVEIQFKENLAFSNALFYIYDMQGKLIRKLNQPVNNKIVWNGENELGKEISPGTYILSTNIEGKMSSQVIIKK